MSLSMSKFMPVTFTGDRIVFMMSHDQMRAKLCCMRPLRSKNELAGDSVPRISVYAQISGFKMKYERRRLGQPCGFLGPAAGRFSDQAGMGSADGSFERGASRSFSGSAVVAILFKVPCLKLCGLKLCVETIANPELPWSQSAAELRSAWTAGGGRPYPSTGPPLPLLGCAYRPHAFPYDVNRPGNASTALL